MQSKIKFLSERTINQIAAGEVVERPISVVKELVENSLDSGANSIKIEILNGGRNLIRVLDNGSGIAKDDLAKAVKRYATSKLNEEDIASIESLGFRGEALPSIASISKMSLMSRARSCSDAWELCIEGGHESHIKPAAHNIGTTVEVRDLFCFTPARLKFLKSENAETAACIDLINRFALSYYHVSFELLIDNKKNLEFIGINDYISNNTTKIASVMNQEFIDNAVFFDLLDSGYKIFGYASIPTYNHATTSRQFLYVNNRIIKDRMISYIIRNAYKDLLPSGRYPAIILFIALPYSEVDVNAHPTKAEVRFKNEKLLYQLITRAIRDAIANSGPRHSTVLANKAIDYLSSESLLKQNTLRMQPLGSNESNFLSEKNRHTKIEDFYTPLNKANLERKASYVQENTNKGGNERKLEVDESKGNDLVNIAVKNNLKYEMQRVLAEEYKTVGVHKDSVLQKDVEQDEIIPSLGFAKCQIGLMYIIAENEEGVIVVDQHAAHERIMLEKMKEQILNGCLEVQLLLIPEVIELGSFLTSAILEKSQELQSIGIYIERNGLSQIILRKVPMLLYKKVDFNGLIKDLAEHIEVFDDITFLNQKINEICSLIACHNSVRAGQKLSIEEMNALLREMESVSFSGQCNHGRPTYTLFNFQDLKKIFERI